MRRTTFLLAVMALCSACAPVSAQVAAPQAPATTIIFVRHAEAAGGDPRDPSLSPAGIARAESLAKALSGAGVAAVYTSQFNRTKSTGEAVAKAANTTVTVVPVAGGSLDAASEAMIARILSENSGRTVLVVGHSNTVPLLVKKASGETVDAIGETEHDRMYIVTVRDSARSVIKAKY